MHTHECTREMRFVAAERRLFCCMNANLKKAARTWQEIMDFIRIFIVGLFGVLFEVHGYPAPGAVVPTGFEATATARLTAPFLKAREVEPTESLLERSERHAPFPMVPKRLIIPKLKKHLRRSLIQRRSFSPTSSTMVNKASEEVEQFVLDKNAMNMDEQVDDDNDEEDQDDVSPTASSLLLRQDSSAVSEKKAVVIQQANSDDQSSGSGNQDLDTNEEDDSDEDLVKPTASAERKAHIHPKPAANVVDERKNNIEKQQGDEMDRLIQLESDIEKMANDFIERRDNIRHPSKHA